MAAGDFLQRQGTAVTWRDSGGDAALTFASLANGAGRKGVSADFGATFPVWVRVELFCQFGTAPTAGNPVSVYWASSYDNSNWDGALASADAAASDTDIHKQLHFVGVLPVDNQNTGRQQTSWVFRLPARYGFPVVYNGSGQSFTATASHHGINVVPLIDQYQSS